MKQQKCKIKDGWGDAGRVGTILGTDIFVEQNWTPVLWDDEEDPTFFKSRALDFISEKEIKECGHDYRGGSCCVKCGCND